MKPLIPIFIIAFLLQLQFVSAQNFSANEYLNFRESTTGISESQLQQLYPLQSEQYLKGFDHNFSLDEIDYLEQIAEVFEITDEEIELLQQNRFFVTERIARLNFGSAFDAVYQADLPVFITTDAILHALHASYDNILKTIETEIMSQNLEDFLFSLYQNFYTLETKYGENSLLTDGLKDADLYVTIAYSLITDSLKEPHITSRKTVQQVWDAIQDEQVKSMPLFTFPERHRNLDFSQFKVRGHYVYTELDKLMGKKSLEPYFRTMMWLGRTDFLLTPPPANPVERPWTMAEIQRMNYGAFIVNELVQTSSDLEKLQFNEQVINYLVGKSDNITPSQYSQVLQHEGITSAAQLTDTTTFKQVQSALNNNPDLAQKILSDLFLMDPYSDEPGILPISFRVSGQRFILDSYIFSNVVYDRLIVNGQKIKRMMPKTLDALFVLGNNDAIPLLQAEFDKYNYAETLANLRYLVDQKADEFWTESLYNVWLNSIRELNPKEKNDSENQPLFMKTAAWHQQKMNTQLASWSQLRHDNLLYAKQSYTGMATCSFPYSYVEPYPEFYGRLKQFADDAANFFSQLPATNTTLNRITEFFPHFSEVMGKLQILAEKELNGESFSGEEVEWLQTMLFTEHNMCGVLPYSGWYIDLFFDKWDSEKNDFIIADVHTQPTDEVGNMVGKVLHVGTGKVNLGVFIANCPVTSKPMAFVGPTMSYYEKITRDFERLTDQDWQDLVYNENVPERPDWTNIYLANAGGGKNGTGSELPSKFYTGINTISVSDIELKAYPNPTKEILNLSFSIDSQSTGQIEAYNSTGNRIKNSGPLRFSNGENTYQLSFKNLPEGIYVARLMLDNNKTSVLKIIKN